jgi:hypothetical protein
MKVWGRRINPPGFADESAPTIYPRFPGVCVCMGKEINVFFEKENRK